MSYSTDVARLLTDQLKRFVSLRVHQLAGQVENLDFWLAEVRHALSVIDGYGVRFVRLHDAQERYVAIHDIKLSVYESASYSAHEASPPEVRRIPDRELRQARKALVDAAQQFLERCHVEGLVGTETVRTTMDEFAE